MAFQGQPGISESSKSSGGGGGPRGPPQQRSVQLQGQIPQLHWPQGQQQMRIEPDYEQCSYVKNLGVVRDKLQFYQAPEYSGGLGKGAAYRLPYMQGDLTDEGCYEHPWQIRSYTSTVTHSVLPARADYVQYTHSVDEALLQHLEWAGQPIPAMEESVAQRFQHMQYNKKLAAKKARKAKAEAALQHRAINDFSGHIFNGLGVKVWGPLNVERLNSCFRGALSNLHNNAIFIGADANWAVAFEYSAR
ncbi:hypothetical protein C0995_009801 [Termitomyces sp. Mi166|nr:hypothetical protein C0995_009801 [Termitomyces sp. Mi166\